MGKLHLFGPQKVGDFILLGTFGPQQSPSEIHEGLCVFFLALQNIGFKTKKHPKMRENVGFGWKLLDVREFNFDTKPYFEKSINLFSGPGPKGCLTWFGGARVSCFTIP